MKPGMYRKILTNVPASDKNPATLLYPIVPKGIETDQCESIFSYLSRLATAHHVSIARLVQSLDEMAGRKRSRHFAHLSQGKSSQEDSLIPALIAATGRSEVSGCTLASLSRTVHFHRTFVPIPFVIVRCA